MNFHSSEEIISWFRDRYNEGTLTLKPPFQRNPVWSSRQRCYLIESILQKLPIPEIFIQVSVTPDGKSTYAIVDGQQRIRTVLQFIGADRDPVEAEFNKFTLDNLPVESPWRNRSFNDLPEDIKREFYLYKFSIRYLETDKDEPVWDMFRRLNKFLTPLKAQEIRNATFKGPFIQLSTALADGDYWVENKIVTPAQIRRMTDIEFVSELLIGVLHGPQGGSAKVIDDYYTTFEEYETEFPDQQTTKKLFDKTLSTIGEILPDIKDTRWSNKTDFYSLFVGLAGILRKDEVPAKNHKKLRTDLNSLAAGVAARLADENAKASREVIQYVRAVEKGANDKARRGDRHTVLLALMSKHSVKK